MIDIDNMVFKSSTIKSTIRLISANIICLVGLKTQLVDDLIYQQFLVGKCLAVFR